jgi:uncharacterized DUF497 family protein
MAFEWDEAKRRANLAKHGLDFADVEEFDWDDPVTYPDIRKNYDEERFMALAEIRGRVHSVTFTIRPRAVRIISFRKANRKEVRRYEKEKIRS